MSHQIIDSKLFIQLILTGAKNLTNHVKEVDALNVFPVPDGDTGTNMNLTMNSGVQEILKKQNINHIGEMAESFSKGLLMGARGNSGVILSQLFRGFAKYIHTFETINAMQFTEALKQGVDTAYKAVLKPVEGTILTVAKEAALHGINIAKKENDLVVIMNEILKRAKETLKNTPNLLPILKQAGVVDSGGQGLIFIYEGFLAALRGDVSQVDIKNDVEEKSYKINENFHHTAQSIFETEDIDYRYCTEFIITLNEDKRALFNEIEFRQEISKFGNSLVVVNDDELVKVHIHTERPGDVLNHAINYGDLHKIKIDNMREQHTHILEIDNESYLGNTNEAYEIAPYGFVAVAMGEGLEKILRSLGVDYIISGGQTMNPSTEDIVKGIKAINAEKVFVLPNNSNIILAAEQAKDLLDIPVEVIPTKSIPQGIAALLAFDPSSDFVNNKELMLKAIKKVKTGQITYAVRESQFEDKNINEGDYLGLADGKIIVVNKNLLKVAEELLNSMVNGADFITIFYGLDAKEEEIAKIENYISKQFPNIEIEIHNGGQTLYPYIFSIE